MYFDPSLDLINQLPDNYSYKSFFSKFQYMSQDLRVLFRAASKFKYIHFETLDINIESEQTPDRSDGLEVEAIEIAKS